MKLRSMSILKYFLKKEPSFLPKAVSATESTSNRAVVEALSSGGLEPRDSCQKKRGPYKTFNEETHTKIGKYAAENGNKAAVVKFSRELDHSVAESTVRGMKMT